MVGRDGWNRSPQLVAYLAWGDGDHDLSSYDAAEPSFGGRRDSAAGRSLRPLPVLRVCGGVLVGGLDAPGAARRRYGLIEAGDGSLSVVVDSDVAPDSVVVDLAVDPSGGIYLLEFQYAKIPTNRLRRLDREGRSSWSRSGPVDQVRTDPDQLRGAYAGLQVTGDGTLWLIPAATSAGLATIDPGTGRTTTVVPLDDDVARPVVSSAGIAYYARITDHDVAMPRPQLAGTDLTTGQTSLVDCSDVPLLDLAGVDSHGDVYARTQAGVTSLDPAGRVRAELQLAGVVVDPADGSITLAEPMTQQAGLRVTRHDDDGSSRQWIFGPEGTLDVGRSVLVQADPEADLFVFQVGGSSRQAGRLVPLHGDGSAAGPVLEGAEAAAELYRSESRFDPRTIQVDADGTVYVPVADPRGCSILAWRRGDVAHWSQASVPSAERNSP